MISISNQKINQTLSKLSLSENYIYQLFDDNYLDLNYYLIIYIQSLCYFQ